MVKLCRCRHFRRSLTSSLSEPPSSAPSLQALYLYKSNKRKVDILQAKHNAKSSSVTVTSQDVTQKVC